MPETSTSNHRASCSSSQHNKTVILSVWCPDYIFNYSKSFPACDSFCLHKASCATQYRCCWVQKLMRNAEKKGRPDSFLGQKLDKRWAMEPLPPRPFASLLSLHHQQTLKPFARDRALATGSLQQTQPKQN